MLKVIEDGDDDRVPSAARDCLLALRDQIEMVKHVSGGDKLCH